MSKIKSHSGVAAVLLAGALAVLDTSAANAGGAAGGVTADRHGAESAAGRSMAERGAERAGGARGGSGDTGTRAGAAASTRQ